MKTRSCLYMVVLLHLCFNGAAQPAHEKSIADTATINAISKKGQALVYENPDSALHYFGEAIRLSNGQQFEKENASNTLWAGVAYYVKGDYDQALPLFTMPLRTFEKNGDHFGLSSCYNYIGLIYQTQHRYDKAIEYHKKGVAHAKLINNKDRQCINNFNIGLAFDESGQYDSALIYVKLAYAQSGEIGFQRVLLMSMNRIGMILHHLKNDKEAELYFNRALAYKPYKNDWEESLALVGLAKIRDGQGKYEEGIAMALKGLSLAKKMHAKWDIIHATEILSNLYAHKKSYKEAFEMSQLMKAYKDSVFNEEKEKQINYIHLSENELAQAQLEKKNAIQSAELKQSRLQFTMTFIVATSFLIIMLVLYSRHRQKLKLNTQLMLTNKKIEQQNRELNEANQTKAKLFSIISHDMRAPFASLHGVLELLSSAEIDDQQRQELFVQLAEAFKTVSGTLDNLLQWSQTQMDGLVSNPKIHIVDELIDKTLLFWKSAIEKKALDVRFTRRSHKAYSDMYQLKIVIRNILGNAIKFTPASGAIYIDTYEGDGETIIAIRDTGIGIPPQLKENLFKFRKENQRLGTSEEKGTGLGLMICVQLIEKNGGSIDVESEDRKGSTFTIKVPQTKL
ncbi:tetratricopeptide repeat-containing sensor histidine kinase [Chryseolinea lacunae]|uniref:histidine kinase n=1 Tax=Chryseolinea lacunae TaxID=2801331 RepID=A0ABS1KN18_9BACT|nr:tetratricopeptide repeat-containing sensor histidine kinase [Chryseolinea lacunae]MBL0740735.1 tetratricopeptide repeat protein [Chryseolinea lacunae]